MKYLIDTNVLSEAVKTAPDKSVMNMLERREHEIVTAAPVWHELQFGCQRLPRSRKREMIASFLNDIVKRTMLILPYDDRGSRVAC
jgi:tRNA(fMet)-specific endonuclease VapC